MTSEMQPEASFTVNGHPLATPWKKLGIWALESVLATVTLGIGWLIWAAMIAGEGYTPAKKILSCRVYKTADLKPATFGTMLGMRGIVGGFVASLAYTLTLGVLLFMPFWDKRNQTVTDKVSSTVIVDES